ncbi:toxic protein SymE [Erwinia toletana]|uniref:Toxic protein SymE n=1 Tax=Winslowiella toletana TaxID=92490 RepID=A0ABS4P7X1_9GAMM|nr:SymE family type I addiction module toxin [Winslowiella toletana]MBP2168740.1 toxic protein SymE [Winslowiella toletana]
MADHDCKSGEGISKAERRCIVGYRPKGGDRSTPQVNIAGKWLREAGFDVGTGVSLKVMDRCLVLIPDDPEEKPLRELEKQLKAQRSELDHALQRIGAALA